MLWVIRIVALDLGLSRSQYLINHFLDENETLLGQTFPVPDKDKLTETNGVSGTGSLGLQAQQCGAQYGKYPNFLLVDVSIFRFLAAVSSSLDTIAPLPFDPRSSPSPLGEVRLWESSGRCWCRKDGWLVHRVRMLKPFNFLS